MIGMSMGQEVVLCSRSLDGWRFGVIEGGNLVRTRIGWLSKAVDSDLRKFNQVAI